MGLIYFLQSLFLDAVIYIFPIFIYGVDAEYSLFHHGYDASVITKCTCMASIAYTSYLCGLLQNIRQLYSVTSINKNTFQLQQKNTVSPDSVTAIVIIIFITFLALGGYQYLNNKYEKGDMGGGVISYIYTLVSLIPVLMSYSLYVKFKRKYIIVSLTFVMLLLLTGSRTFPLALLCGMFYVYSSKHRVSTLLIVVLLFIGIFLMSIVGMLRGGSELGLESNAIDGIGFWNFFLDLIINNRNLYDSYSIVQSEGHIPTIFAGPILAAIPFGQTFFCALTGVPDAEMSSSSYITISRLGVDPSIGLGTNIVGDVYLGGGLIAVVILFYILGYFITMALYRINYNGKLSWYIFYLSMVTSGVFICRGSFFWFVRPFVWTMLIILILLLIRHRKRVF